MYNIIYNKDRTIFNIFFGQNVSFLQLKFNLIHVFIKQKLNQI